MSLHVKPHTLSPRWLLLLDRSRRPSRDPVDSTSVLPKGCSSHLGRRCYWDRLVAFGSERSGAGFHPTWGVGAIGTSIWRLCPAADRVVSIPLGASVLLGQERALRRAGFSRVSIPLGASVLLGRSSGYRKSRANLVSIPLGASVLLGLYKPTTNSKATEWVSIPLGASVLLGLWNGRRGEG